MGNSTSAVAAVGSLSVHPAAELFPMLPDEELSELAEDIRHHGQHVPIEVFEQMILDGRNRLRACKMAGVEPRYHHLETVPGGSPTAYVLSLNAKRRHLSAVQKASVAAEAEPFFAKEAAERQRAQAERGKEGGRGKKNPSGHSTQKGNDSLSRTQAAKSVGAGQKATAEMKAVKTRAPDVFELAKAGKVPTVADAKRLADLPAEQRADAVEKIEAGAAPSAAIQSVRREAKKAELEDVAAVEAKAAAGVYDVIVIDPPWPMEKIERDCRPNQTAFDYPTMSETELAKLEIPCADAAHVWVWTTHRFLPMALRLLEAWSLKYVCTFVWHKPGGFQPIGLPQYNCEFALYARRGSPEFIDTKGLPTCFEAPRGAHSEKPEEFYDVLRRVTAGRRLDMFNRRPIDGFDVWGKEAAHE